MSARNLPNLRRWSEGWGGALEMARRWKNNAVIWRQKEDWTTIASFKRERIPNSRGSCKKTSRTKTCMDTRHRQEISVRWTKCTRWNVMLQNRIQISRLSSGDGLVCNTGDLELDALVNWKPVVMFEQSRWAGRLSIGCLLYTSPSPRD